LKEGTNSDPIFRANDHVVNLFGGEPSEALTFDLVVF